MSDLSLLQSLLNSSRETSKELEASLLSEVEARHRDRSEAHLASQSLQDKLGQAERSLQLVELRLKELETSEFNLSIDRAGAETVEALLARIEVLEALQRRDLHQPRQSYKNIASMLSADALPKEIDLSTEGIDLTSSKAVEVDIDQMEEATFEDSAKLCKVEDSMIDYRREMDQLNELLHASEEQLLAKDEVIRAMCTEAEDMRESLESFVRHNHELQLALVQQQGVTREAIEEVMKQHDEAISKLTSDIMEYTKEAMIPTMVDQSPFARLVTVVETVCLRCTEVYFSSCL